jgi:sigma-E factor negative regulatory protein RseA
MKESLSALIDNEASEIEVHRLLRRLESDDGLRPSWIAFQQVRAVVRGDGVISSSLHLALNERIRQAIENEIDSEEGHGETRPLRSPVSARKYYASAAGLAVAASLVIAVFVGLNVGQDESSLTSVKGTDPALVDTSRANASIVDAEIVDAGIVDAGPALADRGQPGFESDTFDSGELRELDDEKQRQLRAYLNEHDRMARMNPNVRTVLFDQPKGK